MTKTEKRIAYFNQYCQESFAKMFESNFIEQLELNWNETDHARAIYYNMEYNTPYCGKVIFSETLGLSAALFCATFYL